MSNFGLAAGPAFPDVPTSHWAYKFIRQAADSGWVAGTGNNQYSPAGQLTNAQFVKMLATAFYKVQVEEAAASIYAPKAWWGPTSMIAWLNGMLLATELGNSYSKDHNWEEAVLNAKISRYDMAQMALNIMSDFDFTVTEAEKKAIQNKITDWNAIPVMYRDAVSSVYAMGIITGFADGSFGGYETVNRAQAAVILCRLADKTGEATVVPPAEDEKPVEKPATPGNGRDANGYTMSSYVNSVSPSVGKSDDFPTKGTSDVPNANGFYSVANVEIGNAKLRYEFLDMVNQARAAEGIAPVEWVDNDESEETVLMCANDLTIKFQHGRPNGDAIAGGVVIGQGHKSAEEVFQAWMDSPGHRRILMNSDSIRMSGASAVGNKNVWVIIMQNKYTVVAAQTSAKNNYDPTK